MSYTNTKIMRFADEHGVFHTIRPPREILTNDVKAKLLLTLQRSDIKIERHALVDKGIFNVKDFKDNVLFTYVNGWKAGRYTIEMANPDIQKAPITVADVDWFESDKCTTVSQQNVFDVFKALMTRASELAKVESAIKQIQRQKDALVDDYWPKIK